MKLLTLVFALLSLSALAGPVRILDGAQITNGSATLTLPTSTSTLVGRDTTDTLTNKTISGASNTFSNIPTSAIAGSALSGSNSGDVTLGTANGLSLSGQVLSLQLSSSSQTGALSSADWTTFNSKLSSSLAAGQIFIGNVSGEATAVSLSGDATVSSTGVLTIEDEAVTAAKMSSGAATAGQVATADGSGGVSYQSVPSSAPSVQGTRTVPLDITAVGGISFSGSSFDNLFFINGDGAAVDVSANPQISAGSSVGQKLTLVGRSDTDTVKLDDGNGLSLNGSWVGAADSVLELLWDGSAWVEKSRR